MQTLRIHRWIAAAVVAQAVLVLPAQAQDKAQAKALYDGACRPGVRA